VAALAYALYRTAEIRDGPGELDPKLAALLAVAREIAGSTGYGYRHDLAGGPWMRAGAIPSLRNCSPTWR
jgi:hypothetical protein